MQKFYSCLQQKVTLYFRWDWMKKAQVPLQAISHGRGSVSAVATARRHCLCGLETFSLVSESHQCWVTVLHLNRWNFGLCWHFEVNRFGYFRYIWKMASFSWLQRWHFGVPNVEMHVIGFACHTFWNSIAHLNVQFWGLLKFWNAHAKCEANESNFCLWFM